MNDSINSAIEETDANDIANIKIEDIVDMDFLQNFIENFSKSIGVAAAVLDENGKLLLEPSGYTDFCMKLTKGSEIGSRRCSECEKNGGLESHRTGKPAVYRCHSGLTDFAAPIILKGKFLGGIYGGQVLTEAPDENKFRETANEIGVDPEEYISAVKKVKIIDRDRIEAAANVLYMVANMISKLGYEQHTLSESTETVNENLDQISASMEELASSAVTVSENQQSLNDEIQNIKEISLKIHDIIGSVKSIADQTKMLGLNAAIEAARAGEYGKGFGVVSSEIRKLSDVSKDTAEKVADLTVEIQDSVSKTLEASDYTSKTTENQAAAIEEVNSGLQEVVSMSAKISELSKSMK